MTWSNLKPWTVTDSHGQSRPRTEYDKLSALECTHGAGKSGFRTTTCRSEGGVSFSPASARRREREMAKPWRWRWRWRCCCEIRGGRDKRIYVIFPISPIEIGASVVTDSYIARKASLDESTLPCFYRFSINVSISFLHVEHVEFCHLTFMEICKTRSLLVYRPPRE